MSWPWSQLGLPGPSELPDIRHAYAEKLKTTHPEEDPEGFQRLHSAYQLASRMARQQKRKAGPVPTPETEPPRPAPQPPQPREQDFDYDELLRGGGEQPRRPREEDGERDFDYDELLRDGGEQPRRPREEDGERDFDYDELLREDGTPSRPPEEEEPDFDFERLFAEGEAERAAARRRRAEQRRKEQRQPFRERQRQWERREERLNDRFRQEQDRWENTEAILHAVEMMYSSQAGTEAWQKLFMSPLFQQTKGSLDLIFGLEDFVSTKNLSQEVRLALFLAYGFDKGVSRPEMRPLYQMLLPAWKAARREKDHERNLAILGVVLGVAFPFVFVPLLDIGLIPALAVSLGVVWIIWVIRKVVKTGNLERRAGGQQVSKKQERRSVILGVACVAALVAVMSWGRAHPGFDLKSLLPTKDPREQVCRYIKQDYGVEVYSLYNESDYYANDTYSNVFCLEEHPMRQFLAGPDGERDTKNGRPGYTTNLPEMLLLWELKDFMFQRDIYDVDGLDQGLEQWETTGTFLITLPEEGGEEIIEDLGALLEELSGEKWYDALPAQCELVLCSREMEEGRLVLIRVHPATEVYSVSQIRSLYEDSFAHAVCARIIKELGLDRDFIREEGERYTLTNEGTAVMQGHECCKLFGLDETGAVAMEYYVYPKLRNIYCLPGNFWETGNQEDQLGFYRLLHWGDRGTFNLFYPWMKVS